MVEHSPRDGEVMSSIPTWHLAFLFLFPFLFDSSIIINLRVSLIRSLKEVQLHEMM